MNQGLSACLRALYEQYDRPVDSLIVDHQLRDEFAEVARRRTGLADMPTDAIMTELLRMRKSGQLPRLRQRG